MNKIFPFVVSCALAMQTSAAWYWPFGSDGEVKENAAPRMSVLMEPATSVIDDAADLAAEGKISESVEKYREALGELDRIERENPERAGKPEFSTLRNKRAYVNAAIDSLLMRQVSDNARAVAVSDTSELEKKLLEEKTGADKNEKNVSALPAIAPGLDRDRSGKTAAENPYSHRAPVDLRERAMNDVARGDFKAAELSVRQLLEKKPNSSVGLNLKAAMEASQGKFKDAERTLDQAIMSNPRDHVAYYNMSRLMLSLGDVSPARRYYETGRALGGKVDAELERSLK